MSDVSPLDLEGIRIAIEQARKSYSEGGIPIGGALIASPSQKILGSGHNQRIQKASPILHGETAALEDAGRLQADVYRHATMFTTLSPCSMCTGAILLYKIPRVVIGENETFMGEENLLRSRGVEVVVLNNQECKDLMKKFIEEKPEEWLEDIGEPASK
ncbi:hypothetical protein PILCRDRAFT_585941 [Piloderma croceum F 1598]|uniref:Cytosine deaminase n=1 Tax=Piloderma croceum (strain F 1598) TaxID=765440 RepID=A0A0C3AX93_PILCF|nr:hypothetical protein PILCRDRAFT_585941 [Piloderma croceum F 1598]